MGCHATNQLLEPLVGCRQFAGQIGQSLVERREACGCESINDTLILQEPRRCLTRTDDLQECIGSLWRGCQSQCDGLLQRCRSGYQCKTQRFPRYLRTLWAKLLGNRGPQGRRFGSIDHNRGKGCGGSRLVEYLVEYEGCCRGQRTYCDRFIRIGEHSQHWSSQRRELHLLGHFEE